MDKHIVLDFFTRSQRSILGVCSAFSKAFNLPVIGIRICLIVLSLIFIPLGVITYIGGYLIFNQKRGRTVAFALVGALIGVPLSYYFQSEIVKNYGGLYGSTGMLSYLKNFTSIVEEYNQYIGDPWSIVFNVLISMLVFTLIGGAIGYFLDKKHSR